jgi:hypothetical protein
MPKIDSKDRTTPPRKSDPFGCMTGTVKVLPGTDLTAPSEEKWNAEEGQDDPGDKS